MGGRVSFCPIGPDGVSTGRTGDGLNNATTRAGPDLIAGELDHIKTTTIFLGSTNAIEGSRVPPYNRGTPVPGFLCA